jgi:hypothetical protein
VAADASEEEDGIDHLAARDLGRRAAAVGRVEEVSDELPLRVGQLDDLGHELSLRARRDTFYGASGSG